MLTLIIFAQGGNAKHAVIIVHEFQTRYNIYLMRCNFMTNRLRVWGLNR